jgi:YD repeat-containing protein
MLALLLASATRAPIIAVILAWFVVASGMAGIDVADRFCVGSAVAASGGPSQLPTDAHGRLYDHAPTSQLARFEDAAGMVVAYDHDGAGRLREVSRGDGASTAPWYTVPASSTTPTLP